MKRTYIIPTVSELDLAVENIIANSPGLPVDPNETTTTPMSQKRGWSADEWSAEEE